MRIAKLGIVALGLLALGSTGCSIAIDKTFAMKDGSGLDLFASWCHNPSCDVPVGHMPLEGGAVMRILLNTTLLDYLDGTVDGDIQMLDVLFAVSDIKFYGFLSTGLICVVLDDPP